MQPEELSQENSDIEIQLEDSLQPRKKRSFIRRFGRFVFRTVKYTLVSVFLLLLLVAILLQFSFVQTFLVGKALENISEKLGFDIKIGSVYIDLWDSKLYLNQVVIKDLQKKQMINAGNIEADFDYQTVYQKGDVHLYYLNLSHTQFHLITDKKTKTLNINEFIDRINQLTAPKKKKKKASEPALITIGKVQLDNCHFGFHDQRKAPRYDTLAILI
jgi:hypothetical protein